MATLATRATAGTSATLIASNGASDSGEGDYRSKGFLLKNLTLTAPVFVGGSGVTTAAGFQWDPDDGPLEITLEPGESIYGIVTTLAQTIHVLASGR